MRQCSDLAEWINIITSDCQISRLVPNSSNSIFKADRAPGLIGISWQNAVTDIQLRTLRFSRRRRRALRCWSVFRSDCSTSKRLWRNTLRKSRKLQGHQLVLQTRNKRPRSEGKAESPWLTHTRSKGRSNLMFEAGSQMGIPVKVNSSRSAATLTQ